VKQNYQTIEAAATALGVPESVSVTLGEIVADVHGGLLAMSSAERGGSSRSWDWCRC